MTKTFDNADRSRIARVHRQLGVEAEYKIGQYSNYNQCPSCERKTLGIKVFADAGIALYCKHCPKEEIHAAANIDPKDLRGRTPEQTYRKILRRAIDKNTNTSQPTPPKIETINAADLQKAELPPMRMVVPDILTEGVNLLVSRPKLGKSWMALDLALAVATGGTFLQRDVPLGPVLYLALEDPKRRLFARLKILRGDKNWPSNLTLVPQGGWPRMDAGGIDHLRSWCTENKPVLVIIDTLARFRSLLRDRTGTLYDRDTATIDAIQKVANEYRCAILVLHHDRKAEATDPLDVISGSLGLPGGADSSLLLKRERGQHDAVLYVIGRDVEDKQLSLKWERNTCRWQLLGEADEFRVPDAMAAILNVLKESPAPMTPKQIAKALGKTDNNIRVQLAKLYRSGKVKSKNHEYTTA